MARCARASLEPPLSLARGGTERGGQVDLVNQHFRGRLPIVNPDDLAGQLGGMLAGGRAALALRATLLAEGRSFVAETTLSGAGGIALARAAKGKGFGLKLIYVGLASDAHATARVRERVAAGGHDVSPEDISRRFERGLARRPTSPRLPTDC